MKGRGWKHRFLKRFCWFFILSGGPACQQTKFTCIMYPCFHGRSLVFSLRHSWLTAAETFVFSCWKHQERTYRSYCEAASASNYDFKSCQSRASASQPDNVLAFSPHPIASKMEREGKVERRDWRPVESRDPRSMHHNASEEWSLQVFDRWWSQGPVRPNTWK